MKIVIFIRLYMCRSRIICVRALIFNKFDVLFSYFYRDQAVGLKSPYHTLKIMIFTNM